MRGVFLQQVNIKFDKRKKTKPVGVNRFLGSAEYGIRTIEDQVAVP